jgi:hypothetical protein
MEGVKRAPRASLPLPLSVAAAVEREPTHGLGYAGSLAPRNDCSFTRFFSSREKLGVS